jgi:hypothetical protein
MVKCAVKKTGEGAYDVNCDATTSRSNSASVIGMPGVTPVNPATATAVTASTTANAVAANAAKANAAAAQAAAAQAAAAQAATGAAAAPAAANANAAKAKAKAQHQNLIKQIPSASKTLKPISSTSVLQKIPNVTNVPVNAATNAVIKETKDMVKKEADAQRAAQEAAKAAIMNGGRRTKRQPKHTKRKQTKRKQTKRGKNTKRK